MDIPALIDHPRSIVSQPDERAWKNLTPALFHGRFALGHMFIVARLSLKQRFAPPL
jgi:hypothetical protein